MAWWIEDASLSFPVSVRWTPSPPMSLAVNLVFTKHNLLSMLHLFVIEMVVGHGGGCSGFDGGDGVGV